MFIPYYAAYQPLSNGFGQQLVTRYRQLVTQHVQLGAIIVLVYAACVLTRSASRNGFKLISFIQKYICGTSQV